MEDLKTKLLARIQSGRHGDRLPPVRSLMREYGVGQATMQTALGQLARQGLLSLQVGRGTFIQKPGQLLRQGLQSAQVLLLSPRVQTERSHQVARSVHSQLTAQGTHCVQLVYERIEEAVALLRPSLRFDACILQSYFDTVPLALLAFLRERCTALVVDGARLTGVNVDAVASDWRNAMDLGLAHLRANGHTRIGFLGWPGAVQPLSGLRQHFNSLRHCLALDERDMPLLELEKMPSPGETSTELIRAALAPLFTRGSNRPTGLLVWVGSDAQALFQALSELSPNSKRWPQLMVLGHVDRPEDHIQRFSVVGSNSEEAARCLVQLTKERIEQPREPQRTHLLPNQLVTF